MQLNYAPHANTYHPKGANPIQTQIYGTHESADTSMQSNYAPPANTYHPKGANPITDMPDYSISTAISKGFDILSGKWYNTYRSGNIYAKTNGDLI